MTLKMAKSLILYVLLFLLIEFGVGVIQQIALAQGDFGFIGVLIVGLISWLFIAALSYGAAKKIVIQSISKRPGQPYYRFHQSLLVGTLIPLIGFAILFGITILINQKIELGGGDFLSLLAGYLGGKQAAKKLLPASEVSKSKWY